MQIKRGDIYYINFSGSGSEQSGHRPAIVVQNDVGNKYSPTLIVVPLTSRHKKNLPTHQEFYPDKDGKFPVASTALCEQLITVDKSRLGNYIGFLNKKAMDRLDKSLLVSLHLKEE